MLGGSRTRARKVLYGHTLPVQASPWLCHILSLFMESLTDEPALTSDHGYGNILVLTAVVSQAMHVSLMSYFRWVYIRYITRLAFTHQGNISRSLSSQVTGVAAFAKVLYTL